MRILIRRRGQEDWTTFEEQETCGSSDTEIAHRVIAKFDPGGNGKIVVRGWTYGYAFGTPIRPKAC